MDLNYQQNKINIQMDQAHLNFTSDNNFTELTESEQALYYNSGKYF